VTTLALAAQIMTARSCMPFLMVAGEEQADRVTGPALADYHDGVLGVPVLRRASGLIWREDAAAEMAELAEHQGTCDGLRELQSQAQAGSGS
jgi:hypothetical protein